MPGFAPSVTSDTKANSIIFLKLKNLEEGISYC